MKQLLFAVLAIAALALASCGSNVDPVHGTDPMDTTFWSGYSEQTRFPLDEFHALGQAGDTVAQRQLVDQYRKALTANVVAHYPQITDENSIHFVLGSGYAKDVMSGDGKTYSGKFQNELIIIINDSAVKDTVFLACGNGMLSPLRISDRHDFGNAERWRFTILPGEGLAHHLPELESWAKVAGDLSIPIRNSKGDVVSHETYLNYLGKYESVLFPYDVIDLLNVTVYDKDGRVVDFQKRLDATDKANAKAKASKAKAKPTRRKK